MPNIKYVGVITNLQDGDIDILRAMPNLEQFCIRKIKNIQEISF